MPHLYYLGRMKKPGLILCDKHGCEKGIRTPVVYLLREGAADEGPEAAAAARFAYDALREDRRLKKKRYGIVVWNVIPGDDVRVTPIYVRHWKCPRNGFDIETLRMLWSRTSDRADMHTTVFRYYERAGEHSVDDSPDAGAAFLELRARGGASFAAPKFADLVEIELGRPTP